MEITKDIRYVGVDDMKVDLFEGQYPVPNGISYNSYVIMDHKIAVMDTVDQHFTEEWLGNIAKTIGDRKPDYLVVQHMEPDHSANVQRFLEVYPEAKVVGNTKTFAMIDAFFENALEFVCFQLYEDENENYIYEKSTYSTIKRNAAKCTSTMVD